MFLASFATGHWQANCYVVAAPGGDQCVVIDPGEDSANSIEALLDEHRLRLAAVILTHGHFDHVASAQQVADKADVPVFIHPADRHLLSDPGAGLSGDGVALLRQLGLTRLQEPARVEDLTAAATLDVAGLSFAVTPAPGHTAGSVLLSLDHTGHPQITSVVFSGDVLFSGSVGRTDLPGGDPEVMRRTLSEVVLALPDGAAILPGHGGQTSMVTERARNPYLQPSFLRN